MKIHESLLPLADEVQNSLTEVFRGFDRTAEINTCRVMEAFQEERVAEGCFAGYDPYRFPEVYDAITAADLLDFIRENLVEERMALSIIDPKEEQEDACND